MFKKMIGFIALGLFPAIAMAAATPNTGFKSQGPTAHYVISQHGHVVYSGHTNLDMASAKAPEHFVVTVTKERHPGKGVNETFSGWARSGDPMQVSELTNIGYIAKANTHLLKNGTVTVGNTFTLMSLKHNGVQIIGNISRLIRMKTIHAHSYTVQLPSVHTSYINEMVHLERGQSTVVPMGGYQVKITRS